MRLHRFYVSNELELKHDFWIHDEHILHQWNRVLRFRDGQEVVLFNDSHERLYKIVEIKKDEAHVAHKTDLVRQTPHQDIYLFWSLIKNDKNNWVMQKATELGVSHFVPLLADRSEKTGFNMERAEKIIIEAAEQCGRSDIPSLREPMRPETVIKDYGQVQLLVGEQGGAKIENTDKPIGIMVGPEGGWSEAEIDMFNQQKLQTISVGDFTLRAETAAIAIVAKLL